MATDSPTPSSLKPSSPNPSDAASSTPALRQGRVRGAAVWGIMFQVVYAGWQLLALGLIDRYFSAAHFGLYAAAFALTNVGLLAQLGVNRVFLTLLTRGGSGRRERWLRYGWRQVALVSTGMLGLVLGVGPWLPWAEWLAVGDGAHRETTITVMVALVLAFVAPPLVLGGFALQGMLRGDVRNGLAILGCVVTLMLAWCAARSGAGLAIVTGCLVAGPVLVGMAQWGAVRRLGSDATRKSAHAAVPSRHRSAARWLRYAGLGFLSIEIATVVLMQGGVIVATATVGSADVAPYVAMYRLAGLTIAVFAVVGLAYWPAFAQAHAAGDIAWFRRAVWQSLGWNVGLWMLAALSLWWAAGPFVRIWLGEEAVPGATLRLGGLVFALTQGLWLWSAAVLSGARCLKPQVWGSVVSMLMFLLTVPWLLEQCSLDAIFYAQTLATLIAVLWNVNSIGKLNVRE